MTPFGTKFNDPTDIRSTLKCTQCTQFYPSLAGASLNFIQSEGKGRRVCWGTGSVLVDDNGEEGPAVSRLEGQE